MNSKEKHQRKTFGQTVRRWKILLDVRRASLMFLEVCAFISCLSAAAFISYLRKVGWKITIVSFRKLHQPNRLWGIIRNSIAIHLFLSGHAFPFLGALWKQIFYNIAVHITLKKHREKQLWLLVLFVVLFYFTEEYSHGRYGLGQVQETGMEGHRSKCCSFWARRKWRYQLLAA